MTMSWYKTAKLANKLEGEEGRGLFSVCQYCDRLATQEGDGVIPEESKVWKKLTQLSIDEINEYGQVMESVKAHNPNVGLSHGICSYCFGIIEENGMQTPNNDEEERELVEKSLAAS